MADVSVEFGATDVGLEKALQQIQTEMGNLQGKVKSGELSMEELEQTMRRIGQVENMEKRLKAMGDASAESSPKIKKLGDDIDTAGSSAQSVGGLFDAEFKKIAGAFTVGNLAAEGFQKIISLAFDAAQSVVQGFSDALDLGGRLNELSQRTGESAGKLLVLETAFKNSGLEADQVGTAINKLQNFMQDAANGGDKQRAAMQSLGVSMSDLAGKTPTEQMQVFADKIAGIEDPTARAAAASEVFGDKLGGKLLPLFSDFSGNLDDARGKVGSLEQVMDENAATFDTAAETIDAVKGKMAAFAAGILSETLPAVQNFGKALEEADAAGLGKEVGEYLSPELEKLSFVLLGLIDVFKDLKTETDNSDSFLGKFKNAVIGVNQAMVDYMKAMSPIDNLFDALEQKGRAAAEAQSKLSTDTNKAAESLKSSGTAAQGATGKLDNLGTSAQATAQNIDGVFSLGSDFAPKLDGISGSWGGLNEQILGSKVSLGENLSLTDSMTGSVEEQVQALGGVNESLESIVASEKQSEESKKVSKDLAELIKFTYGEHAEKLQEIQDKQAALALKEEERKEKLRDSLNFELAINEAKAAGDTELVKTLENQKLFNSELKKAIDAGMGEPQAREFANRMIQAKNAAESISNRDVSVTVTTKVNRAEYDELMASINAGIKDKKTLELLTKITAVDAKSDWNKAYQTLENMQAINKNFDVALKVSGAESLEEVWQNLNSIPTTKQIQLGMDITGKDTYDEVIRSLPQFAGTKTAKLLLEQQGFENMTSFINTLKGIPDEKRLKLIAETLGTADVNAAKAALDQVLANDGKKATVAVGADTSEADAAKAALDQVLANDGKKATVAVGADISEADAAKAALDQVLANDGKKATVTVGADISEAEQKIQSVRQSTELPLEFQTMADISAAIDEIDRVKQTALEPLTLNLEGDASDVSSKVQAFEAEPIQFSLEADNTSAAQKINALGESPITLSPSADTTAIQNQIKALGDTVQTITFDASASIDSIKSKLKENIDLAITTGEGTKILGDLKSLLGDIKNTMTTLSNKLPTHALA